MKRKILLVIILVFALSSTAVFAQDNESISKIIEKNTLVAKYIQELQDKIILLTENNASLEETVTTQQEEIEQLNQTIESQKLTITTQQDTIANLKTNNEQLKREIQFIDLTFGIYEGSTFGTFKDVLTNKEVTISNNNGEKWRVTSDENGLVRITLPAGKYSVFIPGYKSYAFKYIPERI